MPTFVYSAPEKDVKRIAGHGIKGFLVYSVFTPPKSHNIGESRVLGTPLAADNPCLVEEIAEFAGSL